MHDGLNHYTYRLAAIVRSVLAESMPCLIHGLRIGCVGLVLLQDGWEGLIVVYSFVTYFVLAFFPSLNCRVGHHVRNLGFRRPWRPSERFCSAGCLGTM
jgi:hypothetical protein